MLNHNPVVRDYIEMVMNYVQERQLSATDGYSLFGYDRELGSIWSNILSCQLCRFGTKGIDWLLETDLMVEALERAAIEYCAAGMEKREVCMGAVYDMGPIVASELVNSVFEPKYFCSRIVGFCSRPVFKTLESSDYVEKVIADKPAEIQNNDFVENIYNEIKAD